MLSIRPGLAYALVLVGVSGHASSEFFAVLSGVAGPEVSVWRYMIGSFGLIAASLLMKGGRDLLGPLREDGWTLLWLSLLGVSVAYLAFHWALDFASVIQVATLVTTIPIFVGLINLMVNRIPFTAPKIASGICALIGVALLLTDGYLESLFDNRRSIYGIGLALVCAIFASTYAVLARPLIAKHGAVRITTLSTAIGAIGLWLTVGTAWGLWVNPFALFDRPAPEAWSLVTIGIWNTTITQLTWLAGLAAVPDITRGSYLFFLKPVIAAVLAVFVLSQPASWVQIVAILVICSSVLAEVVWPHRSHRDTPG